MARTCGRYVVRDDTIQMFYGMVSGPHAGPKHPKEQIVRQHPASLGSGTLRRDGFVSLSSGDESGVALTRPFRVAGTRLYVNADVAADGELWIRLCSQTPEPVPEIVHSPIIRGNHTRYEVSWPGLVWSTQQGELRRLEFHLRRADLYSWWFE